MVKEDLTNNTKGVSEHIQKLEPELAKIVEYLRQLILKTDTKIGERIKWNNPSFFFNGEMKPFDPKEFKREMIVFNLFKGRIMLVLPSGAKVKDTSEIMEGEYKDGRRLIVFKDMEDVKAKEKQLQKIIKDWLKLIDN